MRTPAHQRMFNQARRPSGTALAMAALIALATPGCSHEHVTEPPHRPTWRSSPSYDVRQGGAAGAIGAAGAAGQRAAPDSTRGSDPALAAAVVPQN